MILTATVFLCTYVAVSRVPLTYICKGLKVIWMFIFFTAIFSVFNGDGNVIWSWHRLRITDKSVMTTVLVVVRLVYLIIGSSVMTYTTRPMNLANGLGEQPGIFEEGQSSGGRDGYDAHDRAEIYSYFYGGAG